jgi:hypothetical protein
LRFTAIAIIENIHRYGQHYGVVAAFIELLRSDQASPESTDTSTAAVQIKWSSYERENQLLIVHSHQLRGSYFLSNYSMFSLSYFLISAAFI